ncbi:putative Zn finger-like uncharacterized protein [Melaminivora alkalimesophila]|uniref:Putative Zn finger-like uncharacterized protein n=4 Tax=Melaminivora alkalimesophila TaxID=1165852 RepID=A0A317REH9_9BURK|nr:zinc-ribbon and DUF3426 domain-containing protein [Melaminivora alkalimesophila]PWW47913.1 putative Zn finger-like uncharacterized protein [Melaminivora alkalimesophila]
MSQTTRCPHCVTTFRVVADQLRISDGWVRCGQCKEVFDATPYLRPFEEPAALLPDLSLDALAAPRPPALPRTSAMAHVQRRPWPGAAAAPPFVPPAAPSAGTPTAEAAPQPEGRPPAEAPWVPAFLRREEEEEEAPALQPTPDPVAAPPQGAGEADGDALLGPAADGEGDGDGEAAVDAERQEPIREALLPEPESAEEETPDAGHAARSPDHPQVSVLEAPVQEADLPPVAAAAPGAEPQFVRAARRSAFWRHPAVRGVLGLLALALAALLAAQVLLQHRDALAARYPLARAALQQLCIPMGCRLQAPRDIAAVVIDSSSFTRAHGAAGRYELRVDLRNTATYPVAMPQLELTLTDAQDRPLVRRVLDPQRELGAPAELDPGASWGSSVAVQLAGPVVVGYRLLAFHP